MALTGCEPVDYYPRHETPEHTSDLQKAGSGGYGGNNSNFPVGTPGTAGTSNTTRPALNNNVPIQATPSGGPSFNTSGQGAFSETGSYSGANTGGSTSADQTSSPGTTTVGTSSGH